MSSKPDETMAGPKITIPVAGHRVQIGLQSGNLVALLAVLWAIVGSAQNFMREAEETRGAIATLAARLDKVDGAITSLADNAIRLDAIALEVKELRDREKFVSTELEALRACARDRKKCNANR